MELVSRIAVIFIWVVKTLLYSEFGILISNENFRVELVKEQVQIDKSVILKCVNLSAGMDVQVSN